MSIHTIPPLRPPKAIDKQPCFCNGPGLPRGAIDLTRAPFRLVDFLSSFRGLRPENGPVNHVTSCHFSPQSWRIAPYLHARDRRRPSGDADVYCDDCDSSRATWRCRTRAKRKAITTCGNLDLPFARGYVKGFDSLARQGLVQSFGIYLKLIVMLLYELRFTRRERS
jgi:hypothetical protein